MPDQTKSTIRSKPEMAKRNVICPRVIRLRDAAFYLGMDNNRFNVEVRPYVTEVRIGKQGVGFDRLDLDEWFEQYKARNGRPGKPIEASWPRGQRSRHGSTGAARVSAEQKSREEREFEKAVEQAILRGKKLK